MYLVDLEHPGLESAHQKNQSPVIYSHVICKVQLKQTGHWHLAPTLPKNIFKKTKNNKKPESIPKIISEMKVLKNKLNKNQA